VTGRKPLGIAVAVALAMGASYWIAAQRSASVTASQPPPPADVRAADFWAAQLPDLAGNPQPIKQWLGKVVVVNFWAPWCPPCRKEIPGFIRLQDRLGSQGLQIVGVALDQEDKVLAYVDETGMDYPILLGGMQAVELGQAAGNRMGGLPYSVVFDRQGNAVAALVGEVTEERLEGIVTPLL
jgi:thiol-disulfide isomerase/thioredoxin